MVVLVLFWKSVRRYVLSGNVVNDLALLRLFILWMLMFRRSCYVFRFGPFCDVGRFFE